jgi:HK97 family phage portal protein
MLNLIQRFLEEKASAVAPVLISGAGGPQWSGERYDVLAQEAYIKNVISYRCITEIARAVASVPWGVFKLDTDGDAKRQPKHELNKVLTRANPYYGFSYLMLRAAAFLALDGNAFLEGVTGSLSTGANLGTPQELYSHQPDRMQIDVGSDGLLREYAYLGPSGQKIIFPVDRVTQKSKICHIRFFHPLNDWWGLSATRATAREIDTSNEMSNWNMRLMQNGARPGMVLAVDNHLDDVQYEKFKKMVRENFAGSENAGRSLVLDGGKWQASNFQLTPAELDFINGNRELARRIALGYGVPPMLLGIPGDNTYSNYQEARLAFWEDTIFFYLQLIKGDLNNWLFGEEENMLLDYILDNVAALEPRREALWKRAQESDFLSTNEKRALVKYDQIEVEEGDDILVPATMISLGAELDDGTGTDGGGGEDDEGEEEGDDEE